MYRYLHNATRLAEGRAARYIARMTEALGHSHRKNDIDRDIEPENILFGSMGRLRPLIRLSVLAPAKRRTTSCRVLDYLPPEIVAAGGSGADCSYDERMDP